MVWNEERGCCCASPGCSYPSCSSRGPLHLWQREWPQPSAVQVLPPGPPGRSVQHSLASRVEAACFLQVSDGECRYVALCCTSSAASSPGRPHRDSLAPSRVRLEAAEACVSPPWASVRPLLELRVSSVCSGLEQRGREPLQCLDLSGSYRVIVFFVIVCIKKLEPLNRFKIVLNFPFTNLSTGIILSAPILLKPACILKFWICSCPNLAWNFPL